MSSVPRTDVTKLFDQALARHREGRLPDARSLYERILRMEPDHADALHLLGLIAHQTGDHETALQRIGRAIALNASRPAYFSNYGNVLRATGRYDDAERAFRQSIELQPDFAIALNNLALLLGELGRLDEQLDVLETAVTVNPGNAALHCNLGVALSECGALAEAIEELRRAIAIDPQFAEGHYNLGVVLLRQGLLRDARAAFRTATELSPEHAEAHINLAAVLWRNGRLAEAHAACERGLTLDAALSVGHVILGNVLKDYGRVEEAIGHYRRALERQPDDLVAHANLIFSLHYLASTKPDEISSEIAVWNRRHTAAIAPMPPRPVHHDPNRRISIGYVSANLRTHPGGFFLGAVLAAHDRSAFRISCYVDVADEDEHSRRIKATVDQWQPIVGFSDEALAKRIREDEIDILVDMNRFSGSCHLLAFARKPAPVQVSWMGGPITTTGLSAIDYSISDEIHTPPGDERLFVEEVIRVDNAYAIYQAPPYAPPVRPLPAIANQSITFGCFNYLAKLQPEVIRSWARILTAIPGARILLQSKAFDEAEARERMLDAFAEHRIDRSRVELQAGVPHPDLLSLYGQVDIALDPFPYSGGITTCEALWMGVPVITMPGSVVSVRHSVSHLRNAGFPEWIADGPDAYLAIALRLASNVDELARTRAGLRGRLAASKLCDAASFTRQLETAYRRMWQRAGP